MTSPNRERDRRGAWQRHWRRLDTVARARSSVLSGGRRIIARSLAAVTEREFAQRGIYVHAGSGTAESDALIPRHDRTFVALDFVPEALVSVRSTRHGYRCVAGDIKQLPFRDGSVDGIWNLGVHEHFSPEENVQAFREFHRVLKPRGKALVFWPGKYTPYMLLKGFAERVVGLYKPGFQFFPDEINNATSKAHVRREIEAAGLRVLSVSLSWSDLLVFYAAVAEKPGPEAAGA